MTNNNIAEQINQTIEDIWMLLEQTERAYMSVTLNNGSIIFGVGD